MISAHSSAWGGVLRESRLWVTVLWATTLAFGAGCWDWSMGRLGMLAANESIILAPRQPMDEAAQQEWRQKLEQETAILSARWLSPEEVGRQLANNLPALSDRLASAKDSSWIPALLELTPDHPLDRAAGLVEFIAARDAEGRWLVLWDGARLAQLRSLRDATHVVIAAWLALTFVLGALALVRMPWPAANGWRIGTAAGLLGALAPLALVLGASQAGLSGVAGFTLLLVALSGLLLAGGVATVLRLREPSVNEQAQSREIPGRTGPALNLSVKEAPDERNW